MKKIIGVCIVMSALMLVGCGKDMQQLENSVPVVENGAATATSDVMQESLRIQNDKTMTKEEKEAAYAKLQKQNMENMKEKMAK